MTRAELVLEKLSKLSEVAPPGFKGTVKAMKKRHPEIDNPYALAWHMKNKGYKSHKKADGTEKNEKMKSSDYEMWMDSNGNYRAKKKKK